MFYDEYESERMPRSMSDWDKDELLDEIDRLRAELADLRCDDSCSRTVEELQTRAWDAEAAVARVRELCDGPLESGCICVSCVIVRALETSDGGSE